MSIHIAASRQPYHNRSGPALPDQSKPSKGLGGRAVLSAAAALLLISAAIGQRAALVRALPAFGRVFAMAGLPVAAHGPVLTRLSSRIEGESTQRLLTIEGSIGNPGSRAVAVPELRVSVRAADGREIYHWLAQPPKSSLAAGETIAFRAKLADPPTEAQGVDLRFASAEQGPAFAQATTSVGTGSKAF